MVAGVWLAWTKEKHIKECLVSFHHAEKDYNSARDFVG